MWRHYFDKERDEVQTRSDQGTETYTRVDGPGRRYRHLHSDTVVIIPRRPATVVGQEDGTLKVWEVGHDQAGEDNVEHEDFITHLRVYGGEWF